jgi:hypothetical protein
VETRAHRRLRGVLSLGDGSGRSVGGTEKAMSEQGITERLRFYAEYGMTLLQKGGAAELAREAADELDRLRGEVQRLEDRLDAAAEQAAGEDI